MRQTTGREHPRLRGTGRFWQSSTRVRNLHSRVDLQSRAKQTHQELDRPRSAEQRRRLIERIWVRSPLGGLRAVVMLRLSMQQHIFLKPGASNAGQMISVGLC